MTYETMRQFADTWGLVALVVMFVAILVWVFRPGSKQAYDEISKIPLKDDKDV